MAEITLANVTKQFGSVMAVDDVSIQIPDKEFVVLLGPSGSGKSTILRMIAGLETQTDGHIHIGGHLVDRLEPKERNIAFVFQSYALYPHMTVRRNISFPLIMRHWKWYYHLPGLGAFARWRMENRPDIRETVDRTAEVLGLSDMMDRHPRTLSGGQRQRVAVGRAMVRQPSAFLMDEPLSNLDAKLRGQMRSEIIKLYQNVQTTVVYVTHDQVEALTMGTRIVVLNHGRVQQYDTPKTVFEEPANVFVAQFIGSPPMNILDCRVVTHDQVEVAGVMLPLIPHLAEIVAANDLKGRQVLLGIRPERIELTSAEDERALCARISVMEHLGLETLMEFDIDVDDEANAAIVKEDRKRLAARLPGYLEFRPGDTIYLRPGLDNACLFDLETGARYQTDTARSAYEMQAKYDYSNAVTDEKASKLPAEA